MSSTLIIFICVCSFRSEKKMQIVLDVSLQKTVGFFKCVCAHTHTQNTHSMRFFMFLKLSII